jgi:hypothetical protein
MKTFFPTTKSALALAIFFLLACVSAHAADGDLKLEAQLVLGSNDNPSKNSNLKPVSRDIEKKLKHLPLKWEHYYVQAGKKFNLSADAAKKVSLSKSCQISVKNLGDSKVELTLMDQDKTVGKVTQSLHKGQTLVTGAGAENTIVVLWQN